VIEASSVLLRASGGCVASESSFAHTHTSLFYRSTKAGFLRQEAHFTVVAGDSEATRKAIRKPSPSGCVDRPGERTWRRRASEAEALDRVAPASARLSVGLQPRASHRSFAPQRPVSSDRDV
jgi:hypothetical protein